MTAPNTTAPIEEGHRVKVILHPSFLAGFQKAVKDRVGVVAKVFTPLGSHRPVARVVFPPRRKGAKELVEFLNPKDLERVP